MISVSCDDSLRFVQFDRPARRNALTPAVLDRLAEAIEDADEPVVLLTGEGPAFCAGADLDVVAALDGDDEARAFARHGQRVARTIDDADAIVIAGIDGAARGGGLELALACDMRVATPDATFGEPGVTFGLFGAWGGTIRLPEICRFGDAMDLALSGRVVDAEEALRMGLISRIVDDPRTVAEELAANKHDALRIIKRRMRDDADAETREHREREDFVTLVDRYADGLGTS